MGTEIVTQPEESPPSLDQFVMERLVVHGDLSKLNAEQKVQYYVKLCKSLKLNPLTRPFQFLILNNALVLYATKDATEQLRKVYNVSVRILSRETLDGGIYEVVAEAKDYTGRVDQSAGTVSLFKKDTTTPLTGADLANARMRAETKAKRRVTLSIVGLGFMDESELDTVSSYRKVSWSEALENKSGGRIGVDDWSLLKQQAREKNISESELLGMANVQDSADLSVEQLKMLQVMVQMRLAPIGTQTGG